MSTQYRKALLSKEIRGNIGHKLMIIMLLHFEFVNSKRHFFLQQFFLFKKVIGICLSINSAT